MCVQPRLHLVKEEPQHAVSSDGLAAQDTISLTRQDNDAAMDGNRPPAELARCPSVQHPVITAERV